MQNLEMTIEGDILTIKVDLSKRCGKSKSGKNNIVATTSGNMSVPDRPDLKIGLNIYGK